MAPVVWMSVFMLLYGVVLVAFYRVFANETLREMADEFHDGRRRAHHQANRRARRIRRAVLSRADHYWLRRVGAVVVPSRLHADHCFLVPRGAGFVLLVDMRRWRAVECWCIVVTGDVPDDDILVARVLFLRLFEAQAARVAGRTSASDDQSWVYVGLYPGWRWWLRRGRARVKSL